MKTILFYETIQMIKSSSTFWRICYTFLNLQIPILLLSLLLNNSHVHLSRFLQVALVADSDWLGRSGKGGDALNLLPRSTSFLG